jgi:hypothetical protein
MVTVTGTGTSATHTATVNFTITVPPPNDFSISASPTSVSVAQGASGPTTILTATTPPGTYMVTVKGTATSGSHTATVSFTVTATQVATSLHATPVLGGGLTATLTRTDTKAPLPGQTITFTVGTTKVCTATTASNGTAQCSDFLAFLYALFGGSYRADFAGTTNYASSSATAGIF